VKLERRFVVRLSSIVVCFVLTGYFGYLWLSSFPPQNMPDYLGMYLRYVSQDPLRALFTREHGPSSKTLYALVLIVITVIVSILQRFGWTHGLKIVYINKLWIATVVPLAFFVLSIDATATHYNWYWNPELNAPGQVDWWTHMLSVMLLAYLIAPYAIESVFGWSRRQMWFFMLVIAFIAAAWWEYGENLAVAGAGNEYYFNFYMDSVKDVIMGIIGAALACLLYEKVVIELGD